jgi:hypothetical protein
LSGGADTTVSCRATFTVRRGKIVEIDVLADPARLRQLDLVVLADGSTTNERRSSA